MSDVVLSPALRPWLQAGLSAVLLDSPERAAELRVVPSPGAVSHDVAAAPPRRGSPSPPASPPTRAVPPRVTTRNAPQPSRRPQQPGTDATNTRVAPPEVWPPAWQALKNRRPLPPRPLVFWTYAGLGDDLMGTPDPTRQQIMVRMLKELRHPGGTHVFWPYALPDDATPGGPDAPSLFWSGAALLRPRTLLLFGSEARDALGMPKSLVPYCQERIAGRLVIQLPQPLTLAENQDAFRRALVFLSGLLSFCATPRG